MYFYEYGQITSYKYLVAIFSYKITYANYRATELNAFNIMVHMTLILPRVHNIRGRGEYPTSLVWPNALHKVMT